MPFVAPLQIQWYNKAFQKNKILFRKTNKAVNNCYTYILDLHFFIIILYNLSCKGAPQDMNKKDQTNWRIWDPEINSAVFLELQFQNYFNDSQVSTGVELETWLTGYTTMKLTILGTHKMYETTTPSERGVTLWLACLIGTQLPDYILFSATCNLSYWAIRYHIACHHYLPASILWKSKSSLHASITWSTFSALNNIRWNAEMWLRKLHDVVRNLKADGCGVRIRSSPWVTALSH